MDITFKSATDLLGLSAAELGEAFGLSAQTIRQMRLSSDAINFRNPPSGWEKVVARLARARLRELKTLVEALERSTLKSP